MFCSTKIMATCVMVDSVQSAINDIISKNFKSPPEVRVFPGSAAGDGYASKTYSINITGEEQELEIFVKYLPKVDMAPELWKLMTMAFDNELKFYEEISTTMAKFQEARHIAEPFNNVPKHFSADVVNLDVPPIILENIKVKGYTLRDRKRPIDDKHMIIALKAFAKYHAVSYSIKDQKREAFDKLSNGLSDIFADGLEVMGMDNLISDGVSAIKKVVDPSTDPKVADALPTLAETLVSFMKTGAKYYSDNYAVITQGDCWSNNMMFLYDEKTGDPIDVKLIDWQCLRVTSPVFDVAYFFYTVARKPHLDDLDRYLNIYYTELSAHMKKLGSNPDVLYPYEIFWQHWRDISKFGLAMAFMVVKGLLFEDGEIPSMIEGGTEDLASVFKSSIKQQDTYNEIIIDLLRHFVERDFI